MTNGWTEERRRKQAEAIKKWQPWKNSTGPKTKQGKDKACLNALKDGEHSVSMNHWRDVLRLNKEFLKQVQFATKLENKRTSVKNELMAKQLKRLKSAPPDDKN